VTPFVGVRIVVNVNEWIIGDEKENEIGLSGIGELVWFVWWMENDIIGLNLERLATGPNKTRACKNEK
jgi:hypothetical protein